MLGRLLDDSYPAVVRADITTITVARMGTNALYRFAPVLLATIASGLDVSIAQLGVALTIAELCGFAAPVVGRFVDRVSRRRAMTLGLSGVSAGALVIALSQHVVGFAAGLFLLSLSKIVFDVGQGAWITDHVPFERRGRVVGLSETSWALGLLVGVSLMALITAATSWPWAYVAGGVAVLTANIVLWRRVAPDPHDRARVARDDHAGPVRFGRRGWLTVVAVAALAAASQSVFVTFGAWLEDDRGLTTAMLAAVTFGIGALELGASSLSTVRTDRWGKDRSVAGGGLLILTAALALVAFHAWLPAAIALIGIYISGFEFAIVSAIPIAGTLVPGRPGAGFGRFFTAMTIGRSVTTIPLTLVFDRWGFTWCAAIGGVFAGLASVLMTLRHRL